MKLLHHAFDDAEQVLMLTSEKLKNAAADTANSYFTGPVGQSYHQRVEELCGKREAFVQPIRIYREQVGKAE